MITVSATPKQGAWECEVAVERGGRRTDHTVTVSPAALARWARGSRSILRSFDLSVIENYFPEYDELFRSSQA